MKTKDLQILFLILGFAFAIFAGILSFQKGTETAYGSTNNNGGGSGAGASIDIAADGGAAGFAVLSGLCFLSLAVTTLKNGSQKPL
ncbi:hypothetical protein ES705_48010 [subsurface metagenome]